MDAFETSVGYRSLLTALCPLEMEALQQLSEEELLQLAKDNFDADLAEALRSTGEWHWKREIRDVVSDIAEALSFSDQDRYESVRIVLLAYYAERYRRPSVQEYRTYLREQRTQKLSMPQELSGSQISGSQKGEVPDDPVHKEEDSKEQEPQHGQDDTQVNDQQPSLFARVFTTIWSDLELKKILLANVRHELSRQSSRMDIADIVLTILEEDVPALDGMNLRGDLAIEPLVEFLIAYVGKVPLDCEYLEQNGFNPKLLDPKVTASCHSDDYVVKVECFEATLFFAQASDDDLQALREEGYGGGYAADSVAEFVANYDPEVQAMFDYNATLPESVELRGFECHVDEEEAEAWIAKHRPHLLPKEGKNNK